MKKRTILGEGTKLSGGKPLTVASICPAREIPRRERGQPRRLAVEFGASLSTHEGNCKLFSFQRTRGNSNTTQEYIHRYHERRRRTVRLERRTQGRLAALLASEKRWDVAEGEAAVLFNRRRPDYRTEQSEEAEKKELCVD